MRVGLTRWRRTRGGERGGGIGTGSWSVDNRTRSSGGCGSVGGGGGGYAGVAVVALLRKATAATVVTPTLLATFMIGSRGKCDGGSGAGSGGSIGGEMWLVLVLHCEN